MDRVVGSAKSQTNSSAINMAQQQTQNSFKSAMVRVAASTMNLMGMNLLPTLPNSIKANSLNAQQGENTGLVKAIAKIGTNKIALTDTTKKSSSKDNLPRLQIPAQTTDQKLKELCAELKDNKIPPNHSSRLQQLNELNLRNCTNLTPGLLKTLIGHCTSLKTLNLTGCHQLSSLDLAEIIPMLDELESLDLSGFSQVNEKVAEKLPAMFNLKSLVLQGCTNFTSKAFGKLKELEKLETLNLDGCTKLSNTELLALKKLKQLNHLNVRNCPSLTKDGIKALMISRPSLVVDSDFLIFQKKQQLHQGESPQAKKTRLG